MRDVPDKALRKVTATTLRHWRVAAATSVTAARNQVYMLQRPDLFASIPLLALLVAPADPAGTAGLDRKVYVA
jgi:hypothetical protein